MIRVKLTRSEGFIEHVIADVAPGIASGHLSPLAEELDLGTFPAGVQLTYGELRDCRTGDPIAWCDTGEAADDFGEAAYAGTGDWIVADSTLSDGYAWSDVHVFEVGEGGA